MDLKQTVDKVKVPAHILRFLRNRGFNSLNQIAHPDMTTTWNQEWLHAREMGLRGEDADIWENYILNLRSSHVRIKDDLVIKTIRYIYS
jgi:hypothetical protein